MTKVSKLTDIFGPPFEWTRWRMALLDIDGTLCKGELVARVFQDVLKSMGLTIIDIKPVLGHQNWLSKDWLKHRLAVSDTKADQVKSRFYDRFYSLPDEDFRRDVYDDTVLTLSQLNKAGAEIGVFSLRNWRLALHQMIRSGLAAYINKTSNVLVNSNLKITGSGLTEKVSFENGMQDKMSQLAAHLVDIPDISRGQVVVIGDSVETDIQAAEKLMLNAILIER